MQVADAMRIMMSIAVMLGVLGVNRTAFGFGGVLTDQTSRATIQIADVGDVFLVSWDDLPGSGALAFYKDQGSQETRYLPIGGGPFSIIDRGARTLVAGTIVPVYDVITDDPVHPVRMQLALDRRVDVAALKARYDAYEHVAGATETKASITAAVLARASRVNKTCGARIAPQIRWIEFGKQVALAKQTIAILDAIEAACSDKDYRAAVAALATLRVGFAPDGGALQLATSGPVLTVKLSTTSFNPREVTTAWLANHL